MPVAELPYPTRLAAHLAESRRHLVPFESAWVAALAAIPRPSDWEGETLTFTKRAFRDGYLNLGRQSKMGALAYGETIYKDAPERDEYSRHTCGSGEGCDDPARMDGWLCVAHADLIHAIADAPRGSAWDMYNFSARLSECVEPGCSAFAQRDNLRCGRHELAMVA